MSDNDDFYGNAPPELQNSVLEILEKYKNKPKVDLEHYLQSIWSSCLPLASKEPSWPELSSIVRDAFHCEPRAIPHDWFTYVEPPEISDSSSWADFEATILYQVADLRRMRDGALNYEWRYLGVQSPTNHSWYNFDPLSFLECGLAGLSSNIVHYDFQSNWGIFSDFLICGQMYE